MRFVRCSKCRKVVKCTNNRYRKLLNRHNNDWQLLTKKYLCQICYNNRPPKELTLRSDLKKLIERTITYKSLKRDFKELIKNYDDYNSDTFKLYLDLILKSYNMFKYEFIIERDKIIAIKFQDIPFIENITINLKEKKRGRKRKI